MVFLTSILPLRGFNEADGDVIAMVGWGKKKNKMGRIHSGQPDSVRNTEIPPKMKPAELYKTPIFRKALFE